MIGAGAGAGEDVDDVNVMNEISLSDDMVTWGAGQPLVPSDYTARGNNVRAYLETETARVTPRLTAPSAFVVPTSDKRAIPTKLRRHFSQYATRQLSKHFVAASHHKSWWFGLRALACRPCVMSGDLHHAAHSAHVRHAVAANACWFVSNHCLGGDQKARDRCGIFKRYPDDFGRVDDSGLEHINVLF